MLVRIFFNVTKCLSNQAGRQIYVVHGFRGLPPSCRKDWQSRAVYVMAARKQRERPAPSRFPVLCKIEIPPLKQHPHLRGKRTMCDPVRTFHIQTIQPFVLKLFWHYGKGLLLTVLRASFGYPGISSGHRKTVDASPMMMSVEDKGGWVVKCS